MRRGRRAKPVISIASIEAALKAFSYTSREMPEAATLESLALVDMRLSQASRPSAEALRSYTVQKLLSEFLQDGLNQQRQLFDLSPVSENASYKDAQEHLREIGAKPSPSLKAWGSIYYRYFRSDLGFTVDELATFLGYSAKQFGRYEYEGLRLLRDTLIEAEWQCRKEFSQRYLQRSIPENIVPLIGREKSIHESAWALEQNPPMPIFITGAEGIGKTALAASLAKALIDGDKLDYLLWLSRPKRLEDIYNALEDTLLPFPSRVDWRALLDQATLLLVLDDISELAMSSQDWETLSGSLSPAYFILCNREFQPILKRILPISLGELERDEAESLIASFSSNEALLDKVPFEELGGNPHLLAYAAQQILAGYRPEKTLTGLNLAYDDVYASLSQSAQVSWLGAAAGVDSHDERLITKGLLRAYEEHYQLAASAKNYIILRYRDDQELQKSFRDFVRRNGVPLSIFANDWLNFDESTILQILLMNEGRSSQELRQWQRLAQPYLEDFSAEMALLYGIVLRRLASPEAESYLKVLIAETGQIGDFISQAFARYELALLYQSQGKFEKALEDYLSIEAYLKIQTNIKLEQNIQLQRARIAIEQGNGTLALHYLTKRAKPEETDSVLEAEAYLLLGESEKSRSIAQRALPQLQDNPQLAASFQTILGRSFLMETNGAKSIDYLNAALSLSEQFNSDFDIARAKTNLAGAYLTYTPEYMDEAEALLREAKAIQSKIGDFIGLSVSQRTLQQLQSLRLATYKK
jgi:hypothetical protein